RSAAGRREHTKASQPAAAKSIRVVDRVPPAAGGWAPPQAPQRRPVSCSALLGGPVAPTPRSIGDLNLNPTHSRRQKVVDRGHEERAQPAHDRASKGIDRGHYHKRNRGARVSGFVVKRHESREGKEEQERDGEKESRVHECDDIRRAPGYNSLNFPRHNPP